MLSAIYQELVPDMIGVLDRDAGSIKDWTKAHARLFNVMLRKRLISTREAEQINAKRFRTQAQIRLERKEARKAKPFVINERTKSVTVTKSGT
jgi:hypothetical protein